MIVTNSRIDKINNLLHRIKKKNGKAVYLEADLVAIMYVVESMFIVFSK